MTGTVRWTEGWLYVNLLFAIAAHHVHSSLLPPLLLSDDGADFAGTSDHVPDLYYDSSIEHRLLSAALNRFLSFGVSLRAAFPTP